MTPGEKIVARLIEFNEAASGKDVPGDGTCGICGRQRVRTLRSSSVDPATMTLRRVELCGPCLSEDLGLQPLLNPDA